MTVSNGIYRYNDTEGEVNLLHLKRIMEDEDRRETECAWGPCRPRWCQRLASVRTLLLCSALAALVQGMVVNGFVNVSITSIEKRFQLHSRDAGLIASAFDLANLLCLLPVTYLGGHGSKPRWIGIGLLVFAAGSLVYSLPHFLTDPYRHGEDSMTLGADTGSSGPSSQLKYVLMLGQVLKGVGATPLLTLGIVYLDENLHPDDSAFYLGIVMTAGACGPALGYILGGYFLTLHTDFYLYGSDYVPPAESDFIGAWWLGSVLGSALMLLLALPITGFPKHMKGWKTLSQLKSSEVYRGKTEIIPKHTGLKSLAESPRILKVLLKNPTFVFVSLASACDVFLIGGFVTFSPKYIETQFGLSAATAVLIMGVIVISCAASGSFLGGLIIKRWQLKITGIIKFCICVSALVVAAAGCFLVTCPQPTIHVSGYHDESAIHMSTFAQSVCAVPLNVSADCLSYNPVCVNNSITLLNPCHAGCASQGVLTDCACANETGVVEGACGVRCNRLQLFIPLFALQTFLSCLTLMPIIPATIRSVPQAQRSLAIGLKDIAMRLLGAIPGPIVFGVIFDQSCRYWQPASSDMTGRCLLYDNEAVSMCFLYVSAGVKIMTVIFFTTAVILYKPPPKENLVNNGRAINGHRVRFQHIHTPKPGGVVSFS